MRTVCIRPRCTNAANRQGLCHKHYAVAPVRGYVSGDRVRAHLQALRDQGCTWREISEQSGLTEASLYLIRDGVSQSVQAATAHKIVSVPIPDRFGGQGHVPSIGSLRRVRALAAMGWPQRDIVSRVGIDPRYWASQTRRQVISARHARSIADVFDELQLKVGPSAWTRSFAESRGWPPPLAWDEDTIDDPDATADLGGKSTWMQRYEDYRSTGLDDAEVAAAMGIQLVSLRRQLERKAA